MARNAEDLPEAATPAAADSPAVHYVPLTELLETLAQLPTPAHVRRRASRLLTGLGGTEKSETGELRAQTLVLLRESLAARARGSLASRFLGAVNGLFRRSSKAEPPDTPEMPSGVREQMLALLAALQVPERLQPQADAIQARLQNTPSSGELESLLRAFSELASEASGEEAGQMEGSLARLSDWLTRFGTYLASHLEDAEQSRADNLSLGNSVQGEVRKIRSSMNGNGASTRAAAVLDQHLARILREIQTFSRKHEERLRSKEEQLKDVQARLQEAESEAEALRRTLIEHKSRARRDTLTGIANREAYEQRLHQEYAHWKRYRRPLSLIVADIDRFKQINDEYGHATGDQVLQHVAGVLRRHLRSADHLARYGGEEFVVLMPETDSDEARQAAEKLRRAVGGNPWTTEGGSAVQVTLSFGVTEFLADDTGESVFERADRALYDAKHAGRDRVVAALR